MLCVNRRLKQLYEKSVIFEMVISYNCIQYDDIDDERNFPLVRLGGEYSIDIILR